MNGDWFEVYAQRNPRERTRYCGYARFAVDAMPFKERTVERGQVRFYWRPRLPWAHDLPGKESGRVFSGPIAFAEWFAEARCGLEGGEAQAYRKTGSEVWIVEVTNSQRNVMVEVFIDGDRYDANELID